MQELLIRISHDKWVVCMGLPPRILFSPQKSIKELVLFCFRFPISVISFNLYSWIKF